MSEVTTDEYVALIQLLKSRLAAIRKIVASKLLNNDTKVHQIRQLLKEAP